MESPGRVLDVRNSLHFWEALLFGLAACRNEPGAVLRCVGAMGIGGSTESLGHGLDEGSILF
jgi:hypothetical protein